MRRTGILVFCVLLLGAYLARDRWLPYAPPFVSRLASADTGQTASARTTQDAKGRHGGGSHAVTVATATAEKGSLPILRRTIGYITPLASTELAVETTGLLSQIVAKDGASVKEGDLLARLDDRTALATLAKDEAALARDQATLDNARADLDRVTRLVKSGATSTQAGDDAEATVKSAEATVGVDQAQIQADRVALSKTEIRAPFDGRLGAFSLSVGALVQPGTSIVGIAKVAPVYAEFTLPDSDLGLVRKAMAENRLRVEVRSSLAPEATPAETGPIVFIDNKIQETSASITLRAELSNKDLALWPGQSIDVKIEAGSMDDIVVVPGVAVEPREKGSVAYVVGRDNKIDTRSVEVALRVGDQVGVASGLDPGETVVTEGQVDLATGTLVQPVPVSGKQAAQGTQSAP